MFYAQKGDYRVKIKRVLSLVFALLTVVSVVFPVYASSPVVATQEQFLLQEIESLFESARVSGTSLPPDLVALKDATGRGGVGHAEVYQIDTTAALSGFLQDGENAKTIVYKVSVPLSRGSYTLTGNDQDATYNVYGHLTINYTASGSPALYLLTRVSGGYSLSGEEGVVVHAQEVMYGCMGGMYGSTFKSKSHKIPRHKHVVGI